MLAAIRSRPWTNRFSLMVHWERRSIRGTDRRLSKQSEGHWATPGYSVRRAIKDDKSDKAKVLGISQGEVISYLAAVEEAKTIWNDDTGNY